MKKLLIPFLALGLMAVAPVQADDTPLAEQMDILNDAYKALRRTDDAAKGAELAREAQVAVLKAAVMTPEMVENDKHPDGKEKAMLAYKKQMGQLFLTLVEVEEAFVAKDLDKVQELVKDLRASKKKGHNEFIEDE